MCPFSYTSLFTLAMVPEGLAMHASHHYEYNVIGNLPGLHCVYIAFGKNTDQVYPLEFCAMV